jgi:hypothetical protein
MEYSTRMRGDSDKKRLIMLTDTQRLLIVGKLAEQLTKLPCSMTAYMARERLIVIEHLANKSDSFLETNKIREQAEIMLDL